jgi:hypothetical protein
VKKEIIIEVTPDGSIKIDSVGFVGAECAKATKFLEDALGTVASNKKKPEYFSKTESQNRVQQ